MVMLASQFKDIVEPLLNEVFDGNYARNPEEWKPLFKVEKALDRRYQEMPMLYGFGMAPEKEEGAPVAYDAGGEAWKQRFVHKVYALAYSLSAELVEDGDHIAIGKIFAEALSQAMKESKEVVHANIFNRAFSSSYVGGDGVSLLSSAHPLAGGGTFSNKLATPANLSEAALEQIRTQIRQARNERGQYIRLNPVRLIVPNDLYFTAERILGSTLRTGTNNNDVNVINANGIIPEGVHELTRLTNSKAWFVQTDAQYGLLHYVRAPIKRSMEGDFETDSVRYKARERYAASWLDPRCLYGSEGV